MLNKSLKCYNQKFSQSLLKLLATHYTSLQEYWSIISENTKEREDQV